MSGCRGGVLRPPPSAPLGDSDQHKSGEGGYLDRYGGGARDQCLAHSPSGKGDRRHSEWGLGAPLPPQPQSPIPGKVPSPSQLSVTELPGDEVRLEWAAAAVSGVLVYQITWMPLGEGKAREVGERTLPPPAPPVSPAPREGHRPQVDTSPFSPQISVPGNLGTAILPGLGRHSEYEITILAYYRDGARSDPVSLHDTPGR